MRAIVGSAALALAFAPALYLVGRQLGGTRLGPTHIDGQGQEEGEMHDAAEGHEDDELRHRGAGLDEGQQ